MNGSVDPPLLSQDEFFRHLNLQSVHLFSEKGGGGGNGGKYMYRRALKERLRANTKTNYNQNRPYKTYKSKGRSLIHSPQVSPCKGLSDSQRRKIFGRPRVRVELKFEENENDSEEDNNDISLDTGNDETTKNFTVKSSSEDSGILSSPIP